MNVSIILAAGEGTRMRSKTPKVLHEICGKPIIHYVLEAAQKAGIEKNIVILGHGKERIGKKLKEYDVLPEIQPVGEGIPYGTGFAVMQGEKHISDEDTVIIMNGDVPLIKDSTIRDFIRTHQNERASISILTAKLDDPTGYGRIVRDENGQVLGIVEEKDSDEQTKKIQEINSGFYCFKGKDLRFALNQLDSNNAQGEYYITDAVGILHQKGYKVTGYRINHPIEISGVNNRVQLHELNQYMKQKINEFHMMNGVTIIDAQQTYIDHDVVIGQDVTIYPGTFIQGHTKIGDGSTIGPGAWMIDAEIGEHTVIQNSKIVEAVIGNDCTIGPYAYLRPGTCLKNRVKIGDFVEVKNTTMDEGSKASHLAYLGDGDVGKDVNIGCGVILVNYDGKNKHRTQIGDRAFIGSNSNLVAPITIEPGGYVACGSTITEDVKEGSLAIARARQINKENKGKNKYK